MIPYVDFHYGDKTSYRISNPKAEDILTHQSINILTSLMLTNNETEKVYTMHFPTEDVITVTYLTKTVDQYDRDNIDNHTIIIKTQDYLQARPPIELVRSLFKK